MDMQLPDGIQVLERGWLSSNHIVFHDPELPTVVDTGYGSESAQTLALIQAALRGQPLQRIINTHLHSDHAGGNAVLKAHFPACQIIIPPGLQDAVIMWDEVRLSYTPTGQHCERFLHDAVLTVPGTLRLGAHEWQVLPAAGHDHDMVMLWCEAWGILISADALWEKGFGIIFSELVGEPGFARQQATLDLIAQLSPRLVIPGHGAPFTEVDAALQTAHSRIQWLMDDPKRNADNAIKALLAFKLMAHQRLSLADIAQLIQQSQIFNTVVHDHYPHDPAMLSERFAQQLVKVGAAARDGDDLVLKS
ncbi:MBL fold metallo-hydrolase [Aquabacterium sp.]|uniref:MBL fold metallo-hydrolase n=1 Tax=Aquabacterium sp. TaxID=1872578 RepID=UPI002488602C|nr:MBL fold metallo-hydrolase [Aquabacterium sp.]MDI1259237.1 MBL fold metallo-hydrolase [Aquabacterium sp.]